MRKLSADRKSPPSAIGKRVAQIMIEWSRAARSPHRRLPPRFSGSGQPRPFPPRGEGDAWRCAAEGLALDLVLSQPAAAPPFHLANAIFLELEALSSRPAALTRFSVAAAVERAARQFLRLLARSMAAIRRHGRKLVRSARRIVTYSATEAVEDLIRLGLVRSRRLEVWLSESRPAGEGVAAAERLARAGADVTLMTDAALFASMSGADLLLVGANALSRDGVIHKIGTSVLVEAASSHRVPVVVVAREERFLPPALAAFISSSNGPAERLYPRRLRRLRRLRAVHKPFDLTSFDRVDKFVTTWGVLAPAEAAAAFAGRKHSLRLQKMLVSRLGLPGPSPSAVPGKRGRRRPPKRRRPRATPIAGRGKRRRTRPRGGQR